MLKNRYKIGRFIKKFVVIGFSLAGTMIALSALLRLFAGRMGNFYVLNELSIELIHTSRKCVGITALGAYLIKICCY